MRDGLTGLFNHRAFYDRLAAELVRSRRYGHAVGLLMLDIDDFKRFNDRHGHQAGDEVLRASPASCSPSCAATSTPPAATAARSSPSSCPTRRRRTCGGRAPAPQDQRRHLHIRPRRRRHGDGSIGATTFPGPADSVDELVTFADRALYAAKAAGKDKVAVTPGT